MGGRLGILVPWSQVWRKHPLATVISTWFGVGFFPFVPGTWGSAATVPVVEWVFRHFGLVGICVFAVAAGAFGIPAADLVCKSRGDGDPSEIVIDEVAGQAISLIPVYLMCPRERPMVFWGAALVSFFVFRVIDILKPGPVRKLEALPGGLGIVADDLLGGVFAALIMAGGIALLVR